MRVPEVRKQVKMICNVLDEAYLSFLLLSSTTDVNFVHGTTNRQLLQCLSLFSAELEVGCNFTNIVQSLSMLSSKPHNSGLVKCSTKVLLWVDGKIQNLWILPIGLEANLLLCQEPFNPVAFPAQLCTGFWPLFHGKSSNMVLLIVVISVITGF